VPDPLDPTPPFSCGLIDRDDVSVGVAKPGDAQVAHVGDAVGVGPVGPVVEGREPDATSAQVGGDGAELLCEGLLRCIAGISQTGRAATFARARESPYSFPSPALGVAGVAPATRQGKIVMRELTDPGRPLLTAVIAPEGLGA
jgi:hypothetical protein